MSLRIDQHPRVQELLETGNDKPEDFLSMCLNITKNMILSNILKDHVLFMDLWLQLDTLERGDGVPPVQ
jgi:hypothetical protein